MMLEIRSLSVVFTALLALPAVAQGPNATPPPPKEVTALRAEFGREVTRVKEPRDRALRAEGSKLVAKLLRENANAEAQKVGAQIEEKIAGKPVEGARPELKQLCDAYDKALAADLKPIQDRYLKRVDSMIKTHEGRNLDMVVVLAGVRKEVETGVVSPPPGPQPSGAPIGAVVPGVAQLKGKKHDPTGQSWGIGASGTLYTFLKSGRGERLDRGAKQPFTWKTNSKGQIELEGPNFRPRIVVFDATATQAELFIVETGEKSGVLQQRK